MIEQPHLLISNKTNDIQVWETNMAYNDTDLMLAAKRVAAASTNKYKIGAVIVNSKGQIIATGNNHECKTHPVQARFAKKVGQPKRIYLHAEIAALVRCREQGETLYVARIRNDGNVGISKPCAVCMEAIRVSGIKRLVYYDRNGNIQVMEL